MTDISGSLVSADGTWSAPVTWNFFEKPAEVGHPGKTFEPWWEFTGWATPMICPSRKATAEWIYFSVSPIPGELRPGDYVLTLGVTARPDQRRAARWSGHFKLGNDETQYLHEHCVAVGNVAPDTCKVTLTPA